MKITIENNELVMRKIARQFTLKVRTGTIEVEKYEQYDDMASGDCDSGWEFVDGESHKLFKKLTEDEQEQVEDFIDNLDTASGEEIVHTTKIAVKK